MYVRDAKNRDEVWLLDSLEELGLDDGSFRSRDYVIALDEESNEKAGFGRIRVHKGDTPFCEITCVGVPERWRRQGVGAHVVERLVDRASAEGFDTVYGFSSAHRYCTQFGFEALDADDLPEVLRSRLEQVREADPDAIALRLDPGKFMMPERLRERFKVAAPKSAGAAEPELTAEDFGYDEETPTKYSTNLRR
ncbi:GNAT family N-acetyltransferase [Haloferax mediterranei ATCC 33500]|uniref:Acetyltransferase n=1 Tax=Haloferax mediterranei (strain ATCC 33500 / DSM 1411 / JCM 8866 / NBRC 14739 / NCIMB 2177 / R-4) TaxID=523841 RepID=I3R538_HALMT|nr:GNAT family N-acetyltransferase [Haloferax mediterranei]AFK19348.1 acetyltransferase [Haloferax mediterranei ATCC 33500]AHZ21297.1 acetyltransferase [Haloferax mediterranei ATCC 33500]EMA04461.1 acetyltransferase [Haloferax mediterranei ATCC 33500]MDX5989453.1 GNAT family N-acetyltransferase [Haloferax mediterranei ATCC 33500]QCQ75816.1 GNAT family N-acetyltransferase [Haloferax mediterranei ATCC 33500]